MELYEHKIQAITEYGGFALTLYTTSDEYFDIYSLVAWLTRNGGDVKNMLVSATGFYNDGSDQGVVVGLALSLGISPLGGIEIVYVDSASEQGSVFLSLTDIDIIDVADKV